VYAREMGDDSGQVAVGIQFVNMDPIESATVTSYVWNRLRELHPTGIDRLRRMTDRGFTLARREGD